MLITLLCLPFLFTAVVGCSAGQSRLRLTLLACAAPLTGLVILALYAGQVLGGEPVCHQQAWLPALGLNLNFCLDGLSFLFALLILGIGLLVIIYARYYLSEQEKAARFFSYLLLFMGSMLGLVLASNLLLMLLFWEMTSLSSFLLIGFWSHKSNARSGARMALTITGGGGLALMAGIILLGNMVGSYELADVVAARDIIQTHSLYPVMLVLVLLGAFTKSAQFPFHFWLPHAMSAPTPVSAYLHSATMVKAGVFLLARLYPVLSGTDWWFYLVTFTGLITLLLGAITALFQHDLKGLLAYSTVSHLGLITMLFGLGSDLAPVAAIFHIINHATFKASLFMAAGIIDHETGTRDMRQLSGLWRYMPHTAMLAMVASSAMAGVPLLNGFLSKEMFFAQTLHQHLLGSFSWLIPGLAILASLFAVAYSLRFIHDVFFGAEAKELPIYPPKEPPRYMKIPVEILVFLCLLVGMLPAYSVSALLASAAQASLGGELPDYSLAIWHGLNAPLLMSCIALAGGSLLYVFRARLFSWHAGLPTVDALENFKRILKRSTLKSALLNERLQGARLQRFIAIILLSLVAVLAWKLWPMSNLGGDIPLSRIDPLTLIGVVALMLTALLTVFYQRHRLLSLVLMSIVGLVVTMLFARFSAPDLALTQLVVEVVTILLFLLVLNFIPEKSPVESSSLRRMRDFFLALTAGGLFAILAYAVLTRPYESIADFYLNNSVSGGGGTNVVNVILVDFRGFDTLGEISVLAITAIAVLALLRGLRLPARETDRFGRLWDSRGDYLMLRVLTRLILPLALVVAVFIFLRGHNLPGGGFVAGLVTVVALVLLQVGSGQIWVEQQLHLNYRVMAGVGVLVASCTGLGSLLFGKPFLTSAFAHYHIPGLGELELATAILFDLGVYLTVVGSSMLMLTKLGRQGNEVMLQEIK